MDGQAGAIDRQGGGAAALDPALDELESQFGLALGDPRRVRDSAAALWDRIHDNPALLACSLPRLSSLLRKRTGPMALALQPFFEELAGENPVQATSVLLGAKEGALRRRGLELALRAHEEGRLSPGPGDAEALAAAVEEDLSLRKDPILLPRLAAFVQDATGEDPEQLLLAGSTLPLRLLAARSLDQAGGTVPRERLARLFDPRTVAILAPLIEYTRAGHRDLVELTPEGHLSPLLVDSLQEARKILGDPLLGKVLGELGWSRVAWGLSVRRRIGLSLEGGFPLTLSEAEASLLKSCFAARRVWSRFLIVAHGGGAHPGGSDSGEAEAVQRFRRYNLLHAELLSEILEVAPLTTAKLERMLSRMDQIVEHFRLLFAGQCEDAARVGAIYAALRDRILAAASGASRGQPLESQATRLVQMFEDPQRLDEVRTLHGLKRYLHQQGLRHAFRVFRSGRTTNRTVDLVLASGPTVMHVVRGLRYLDFDPDPEAPAGELPYPVALITEALGRALAHGRSEVPGIEVLIYGNEVQVYVSFRNHPVFIRLDLSPPLRGGMIDLEYYGVSQYEVDGHPDLSLPWIQRMFRRMEFDVQSEGVRLHVRYDKERAFDLADLARKFRSLCHLLPHLMEIDWVIGGLRYPEAGKAAVADAWADWISHWGILPIPELLTGDRSRILRAILPDPAGEREVAWDGLLPYRDRFTPAPGEEGWARLRERLQALSLDEGMRWSEEAGAPLGQLVLEARVLEPLREAGLLPRSPHQERRIPHAAERIAALLNAGGDALRGAMRAASLARALERSLRFQTIGSVQRYLVQSAALLLQGRRIELAALRDADGIARLAVVTEGGRELDPSELMRRLRRDNYLTAGADPGACETPESEGEILAAFALANPLSPPAPGTGERMVAGISASPGSANGLVRFGAPGRAPADLEGAVLFAPAIRPEDTPLLRRCAAVVSTGGGILSHAGLIALELHKPSLIVAGSWQKTSGGADALAVRYLEFREEATRIGTWEVVRRCDLHEHQHLLLEGDLVAVDADLGVLRVLGRDRDALALHQGLSQLVSAGSALAGMGDPQAVLSQRGRWLRAIHQLEKLFSRLERPELARHAVRELLRVGAAEPLGVLLQARSRLLSRLFGNPACGALARETAGRQGLELCRQAEAMRRQALAAISASGMAAEILHSRHNALRVAGMVEDIGELLRSIGFSALTPPRPAEIDRCSRRRLEEIRSHLVEEVLGPSGGGWRMRHLLGTLRTLRQALGSAPGADPEEEAIARLEADLGCADRAAVDRLSSRILAHSLDGGLELAPLVGAKAANLGEVARILGPRRVPAFFSVTNRLFRELLETPAARLPGAPPSRGAARPVGEAVGEVLASGEMDAFHKEAAIREIWLAARIPPQVEEEIREAYRSLGRQGEPGPGTGWGDGEDSRRPFVAIRSSSFEEDTRESSWAGQFDTFLYVRGEDSVLEHLKRALAGLWTARAIHHREQMGSAPFPRGGGVLIQRIVHSRASGVLHTLAVGQSREMVLNVGLGLGEGIVSGTVEVDHIVVAREGDPPADPPRFRYLVGDKTGRVVFDRRSGSGTRREETLYHQRMRPAMEYTDLCETVRAALLLEQAYGYPLDVEFAFEADALYILQVRPIVAFQAAVQETIERWPLPPA